MISRLNISFPLLRQRQYWFGEQYKPAEGEYLLNHARTGIVMALKATLSNGGRVGVVAYNCHTVANAVVNAGCVPVFLDVTEDLWIDLESVPKNLDAIVVTNLFGIRNDVEAIRKRCPGAVVIVDNAHGYGLPVEGDFMVYSINQGKFPSLGPGGILVANGSMNELEKEQLNEMYASLPEYNTLAQVKLFIQMWGKAMAYSRLCYWLLRKLKKSSKPNVHQTVIMKKMAPGIRRLYNAWLPNAEKEIAMQKANATQIIEIGYETIISENAFMAVIKTINPDALQKQFTAKGVETATHFNRAIEWASEFGYKSGTCPIAEKQIHHLLMVPTYRNI